MYEEKDYILRLIHEIIRVIAKLLLKKDIDLEEDSNLPYEIEEQYKELISMAECGDINSAENLLIDKLDLTEVKYLQMALMFYTYLNEKTDSCLAEQNYTRAEILDGIKYISGFYGYGDLVKTLMEDPD